MDLNESAAAMTAVEQLMEEFFNPMTCNARKHEIESQLSDFRNFPHFYKLCLYFLSNSTSQYLTMFALSSLETVINQQWLLTDWGYREELKGILYGYLIERGSTAPHVLRNKYAKLLVDIAKQDWPNRYPNFFSNILELLKNEHGRLIGLVLLRTASEELMNPTANFSNDRKEEISRLLLHYIPSVFQLLTHILEGLGAKPRHSQTATPPPSPTHPSSPPSLSYQLATASFRTDSKVLNKEVLATVQHLFTWVEIAMVPTQLVTAIFNFTNVSSYAQEDDDMCILAMSAINELLYRKFMPPGTQDFFIHLYHHTVQLLRDIACPSSGRIETLGPDFMEKLSELTTLLIEQHLWRLEMEPCFSALEFLSLLYQLTMQLPTVECYLHCLTVWSAFIKQIKPQNAQKYYEVFHGLVSAVLRKIQFTCNHVQLSEINDVDIDDDNETDYQAFLKTSIELIAIIGDYSPVDTFNQVLLPWKNLYELHGTIQKKANIPNTETEKLVYVLKDFSSVTRTLARLSSLFIDQDNEEVSKTMAPSIDNLICRLLESASFNTKYRKYNLQTDKVLRDSFTEVHSELLAALRTWLPWLSQNQETVGNHLRLLLDVTLPLLHIGDEVYVPDKISSSAAHLLLSITDVVFPPSLFLLPPVRQFLHVAPVLRFNNLQTWLVINSAMCNLLLRPWGELSQEDAAQRSCLVGTYFDRLTKEFKELTAGTEEERVNEVVGRTLPVLAHIVEFSKKFSGASKKMLYIAIKPSIEHALALFSSYVKYPDINNHILVLFLNVLGVLQQQVGVEGTKNAVQVFLQVAVSEQQTSNLSGLDKLLQILQFVVEAPGSSYKNFLPGILELCMDNVYPIIVTEANQYPDVYIALLTLLHSILRYRWQYFYVSQVRLGYSPGCSDVEAGPDSLCHPEQLLSILQVFGQALLQQDINVFRLSLAALEDLNVKWKLYHKVLFREHLLCQFLNVLLQTLIHKSQALLTEDIQVAVYNMAAVNFEAFFSTFLHQFVRTMEGILPEQWESLVRNFVQFHDKDMPTFIQHLQRFVNDTCYYRQQNVNLSCNRVLVS